MKYEGCRIKCRECKFCPKIYFDENNKMKYKGCKMIDHDSIKLLAGVFSGYEPENEDICRYYEPAEWNISGKQSWTGIEDYIEFLDKDYYITPSFLIKEGKSKIRDIITIPLVVGTDIDRWGDYVYHVSLYDWLTGEAVKDSVIKYRRKYEVIRTKNKKAKTKKLIEINGKDKINN